MLLKQLGSSFLRTVETALDRGSEAFSDPSCGHKDTLNLPLSAQTQEREG